MILLEYATVSGPNPINTTSLGMHLDIYHSGGCQHFVFNGDSMCEIYFVISQNCDGDLLNCT